MLWIVLCACSALIGYLLGRGKDHGLQGAILAGLLGPIGWLIIIIQQNPNIEPCPVCFGKVNRLATRCMHCGADLRRSRNVTRAVTVRATGDPAVDAMLKEDEARMRRLQDGQRHAAGKASP